MPGLGVNAATGLCDWETYLAIDRVITKQGLRIRFYRGTFEIMSISRKHEGIKSVIGMLVEAFCLRLGIDFYCWGSATNRIEGVAGAEPDESYVFGAEEKENPDLVIEVGLTSGGIDKCELWAELGARELWVWEKDRLHAFSLVDGKVEPIQKSLALPGIQFAWIGQLATMQPASAAVREFQQLMGAANA